MVYVSGWLPVREGRSVPSSWIIMYHIFETDSLLLNFELAIFTSLAGQKPLGSTYLHALRAEVKDMCHPIFLGTEAQVLTLAQQTCCPGRHLASPAWFFFSCVPPPFDWYHITDQCSPGAKRCYPVFTFQHMEQMLTQYGWRLPSSAEKKKVIIFRGRSQNKKHLKSLLVDGKH